MYFQSKFETKPDYNRKLIKIGLFSLILFTAQIFIFVFGNQAVIMLCWIRQISLWAVILCSFKGGGDVLRQCNKWKSERDKGHRESGTAQQCRVQHRGAWKRHSTVHNVQYTVFYFTHVLLLRLLGKASMALKWKHLCTESLSTAATVEMGWNRQVDVMEGTGFSSKQN